MDSGSSQLGEGVCGRLRADLPSKACCGKGRTGCGLNNLPRSQLPSTPTHLLLPCLPCGTPPLPPPTQI